MAFTAKDVQALRERTNCGMMDCKKALTEADGDMDKAIEKKKEKGIHDYDHITDEDILGYTEEQTMDLMVELMR